MTIFLVCLFCDYYAMRPNLKGNTEKQKQTLSPTTEQTQGFIPQVLKQIVNLSCYNYSGFSAIWMEGLVGRSITLRLFGALVKKNWIWYLDLLFVLL